MPAMTRIDIDQLDKKIKFGLLSDSDWQLILLQLKKDNVPTTAKKLRIQPIKPKGITGAVYGDDTEYSYYHRFINDTIYELRRFREANAFKIYQIEELLRFFPNLEAKLYDNIFYLTNPR